jgi:hypothetical protein
MTAMTLKRCLEEIALYQARNGKLRLAAGLRCPEHGACPRIVPEGTSLRDLAWRVDGCCELIEAMARIALDQPRHRSRAPRDRRPQRSGERA